MSWYPVLAALNAHLTEHVTGATVTLGGDARIPTDARVIVLRGPSKQGDPRRAEESTLQGWVECWEHDAGPAAGYAKLATLEESVIAALRSFGQQLQIEGGQRVRVEVEPTEGDGDVFRPSIGSRTPFTIRMRTEA